MRKYLIYLIAVFAILPQVAFATWWNPFSWNKADVYEIKNESNSYVAELEQKVKELEQKLDIQATTMISTDTELKVTPKVETKVIMQTIKVDNPELQVKINDLLKQNTDLQIKVASQSSLVQQLNTCKLDLVGAKSQIDKQSSFEPTNASIVPPAPILSASLGARKCGSPGDHNVLFPIIVNGGNWKYGEVRIIKGNKSWCELGDIECKQKDGGYGMTFENNPVSLFNAKLAVSTSENNEWLGTNKIKITLGIEQPKPPYYILTPTYTTEDGVTVVENECL